jgi:hypothetical protein
MRLERCQPCVILSRFGPSFWGVQNDIPIPSIDGSAHFGRYHSYGMGDIMENFIILMPWGIVAIFILAVFRGLNPR